MGRRLCGIAALLVCLLSIVRWLTKQPLSQTHMDVKLQSLSRRQQSAVSAIDPISPQTLLVGSSHAQGRKAHVSNQCAGLLSKGLRVACAAWYRRRDGSSLFASSNAIGARGHACKSACHGRGICDEQTGICACQAGYNGTACEGINVRECNGATDGLWVASHCAGECDERRGYCFCPGKINERPMSDTCQVRYMPVDSFAALTLKPDPAWIRFAADGKQVDLGIGKGSGLPRAEEQSRRHSFDTDLHLRKYECLQMSFFPPHDNLPCTQSRAGAKIMKQNYTHWAEVRQSPQAELCHPFCHLRSHASTAGGEPVLVRAIWQLIV